MSHSSGEWGERGNGGKEGGREGGEGGLLWRLVVGNKSCVRWEDSSDIRKVKRGTHCFAVLRMGSQFIPMTVLCPGSGKGMRCI